MMRRPRAASAELEGLLAASAPSVLRCVRLNARALLSGDAERGAALAATADVMGRLMAWADLLGRRRSEFLYQAAIDRADFAARGERMARMAADWYRTAALPEVEFEKATDSVLSRYPALARGWRAVAELYATRHAFAAARAMSASVARRVQLAVAAGVKGDTPSAVEEIVTATGWDRQYAETVYRTNAATAYSAGMWARMADPDVAAVIPGQRYVSQKLPTSRPNHVACDGLIAPNDSRLWDTFSPPLGYGCLCSLEEVSVFDAEREGLIGADGRMMTLLPPGFGITARPDPGFGGGRPDRVALYGEIGAGR